ncbi:MAG: acyl-ACP--UDP-N-acetylglucosamine O-acyltransferase [Burkholderiales bacterium]
MIHPTAIVHPGARLDASVEVGAYSIIGEHVEVGQGTSIGPHAVIDGHTRLGRENRISPFSVIGGPPQDKKYAGEPTRLEIGDRNTIREYCTFSTGTLQDAGVTRIGSDNWIMAYCHIAHDCQIGDDIILANNTQLAGHVIVQDFAVIGGFTGVHQFVRIGAHSMTGGGTMLRQDLPPYVTAAGNPPKTFGINAEGLRRRGYSEETIHGITRAYKVIYRSGLTLADAQASIATQAAELPALRILAEFLAAATRGIVR